MPKLRAMADLDEYWIEINRLENSGDKSYRRTLAKLFSGDFKAIEVLKLKDIITSLEGAIDAFEKVANIVEQIAVNDQWEVVRITRAWKRRMPRGSRSTNG